MKRGFVKAFLHIFSFVSLPSGIFCISVKTHEVGRSFLVKIAYIRTCAREKARRFRDGQPYFIIVGDTAGLTPIPDGRTAR